MIEPSARKVVFLHLFFCLLSWPAVSVGLYVFRSVPAAFACYHGVCLLGILTLSRRKSDPPDGVGGIAPLAWERVLVLALVAHLLIVGGAVALGPYLFDSEAIWKTLNRLGISRRDLFWIGPYFVLVNPWIEERFWRGSVLRSLLVSGWPWRRALAVSSCLFAAWHAVPVALFVPLWALPIVVAGIATVGAALGVIWRRTDSIRDCVLLHALAADLPLILVLLRL